MKKTNLKAESNNFICTPDEFINEFTKEVKKHKTPPIFETENGEESLILVPLKQLKTKVSVYKLFIKNNVLYGIKENQKLSKSGVLSGIISRNIQFTQDEWDKYFNFERTKIQETPKLVISKEEFLGEFFAEVNEHELVMVFPPDKKVISFITPNKNNQMVEYTINCSVPVGSIGTKGIAGNYANPITFTKEETDLYFSFPQQPKEDLGIQSNEIVGENIEKAPHGIIGYGVEHNEVSESISEYDFIQDLLEYSKLENTQIDFDDKGVFRLLHKTKNPKQEILFEINFLELDNTKASKYINNKFAFGTIFGRKEAESYILFMNIGLNLKNKING